MSKNLEKVIQRAISDAAFRRQLQSNPEAALRGLKLTPAEVAALRSGDAGKLTSLGIDQRMSKTFTFGGAEGATRAMTGSDLGTSGGSGAYSDRDLRQIGDATTGSSQAVDSGNASGETRMVAGSAGGSSSALDPGAGASGHTVLVGDPMSERSASSVIGDPENPANARGYIGEQASAPSSDAIEDQGHAFAATRSADVSASASNTSDPENPANARGYIGEQASAPSSDAIEGQSHDFAATRSADVAGGAGSSSLDYNTLEHTGGLSGSAMAAPIPGSPEEFAFRDQGASTTASNIGDPDNANFARGYTGGGAAAPSSDAIEGQSHDFAATRSADVASGAGSSSLDYNTLEHTGGLSGSAMAAPIPGSPEEFAFRDQGASTTASNIGDPENPNFARGYVGEEGVAPTSDALEDQSHAIAASRSDAFLSEGEVGQYSDPSLGSDQAEDEGNLFNPNASDATPDDSGTISQHHDQDLPT